jgi:predicted nicotinamide N-methyase
LSGLDELKQALQSVIPAARLELTPLPQAPDLALFLLNADYPQGKLTAQEVARVMDNPLYWVFCWASGQVLARYLLDHPETVRGRRVLDFGCGCGVVAIAAARAGAREVIACDIDPLALLATRANAAHNDAAVSLAKDFDDVEGPVDLILVADVLYDRGNFPWLTRFVERADAVLVADSRVKSFDVPPYRRVGQMRSCTLPDLDESEEFRDVRLYRADEPG